MKNKYKTLCVVNPASANGRTKKSWDKLENYLKQRGLDFAVKHTSKPKDAIDITREALYNDYSRIVSVGGDGTLNEVVNGFYNSNYSKIKEDSFLSFIPMGTGGDFARMFTTSDKPQRVYDLLSGTCECPIDIVKAIYTNWDGNRESRFFINVADVGLGCQTARRLNQSSKALGGFLSFLISALYTLVTYESQYITVKIDDKEVYTGKVCMVVISNGSYFGGGMKIAPYANLNDGLLDIIIVDDLSKIEIIKNIPGIYKGEHINHPAVFVFTGKKVELNSPTELLFEFDGETPGIGNIELEVIPKELKLLL